MKWFKSYVMLNNEQYHALNSHEDNVVNHRLSWLLAGQPLLFLAYVNCAVAHNPDQVEIQNELLKVIPWLGIGMSVAILVGVVAAAFAMLVLSRRRISKVAGVTTITTILGMTPPVIIPILLIVVWISIHNIAVEKFVESVKTGVP